MPRKGVRSLLELLPRVGLERVPFASMGVPLAWCRRLIGEEGSFKR
jgi:hypothetical protein